MISLIYELIDSIDQMAAALVWFVPANDSASVSCCSQRRLFYREGTGDSPFQKQQEIHISHRFCRIKFLLSFFSKLFFAKGLHLTGSKVLFAVRSCVHPVLYCVQHISIRAHFSRFKRPICSRSILCVNTNIFLLLVSLKSGFKAFASVL